MSQVGMGEGAWMRVLFLQLPLLDNDVSAEHENVPLAGRCLAHALRRDAEGSGGWDCVIGGSWMDRIDDRGIVSRVHGLRPDFVVFTLYLWNVERSLRLMGELKREWPGLRIVVGGPEVARDHPFLFESDAWDCAVCGEGEWVLPELLGCLVAGREPDLEGVAWRCGDTVRWGRRRTPAPILAEVLPPARSVWNVPDSRGVGCVESSRGCPYSCAFCRYSGRKRGVTWLEARLVAERVRVLIGRGAREIRFTDPMLNSNPRFEEVLRELVRLNRGRLVRFFGELRCETITAEQARLLARAGFREVEVGLQSLGLEVLRAAGRPGNPAALERGMRLLADAGLRITLDVMCGLPRQDLGEVRRTLRWAAQFPRTRVQFLHSLLLPGTRLRAQSEELGLIAQARPPYRVLRTREMSEGDFAAAERIAQVEADAGCEHGTARFVGLRLPDLFPERVRVRVPVRARRVAGRENRRALVFVGSDLFRHRAGILSHVQLALETEPSILWQFVLMPRGEEPLDLLEELVATLDRFGAHLLDRMVVSERGVVRAARRVLVQLEPGGVYSRGWVRAVEEWLADRFI